ncbi:MAG: HDOD domain-containing protein [Candidatus Latescibacterota bacterium]
MALGEGRAANGARADLSVGPVNGGEEEFALVVHQAGEDHLVKYLTLVLNYLYGLSVLMARRAGEASALLMERGEHVRCAFLVQDEPLTSQIALAALSLRGRIPVFLLLPPELVEPQRQQHAGARNLFICSREAAAAPNGQSLRALIDEAFERNDIGGLFDGARHLSFRALQQRVQRRLRHLSTLPTLPEVVLRILKVTGDPEASVEEVQDVLHSDTAVVHKLLQVVNTTHFAGFGQRGRWELRDTILRLGRKKIGSIALQIKLINSLVRPEGSGFDLHRFWTHAVGSALVADLVFQDARIKLDDWESCSDYWVAALLHDVGRLVLGFFFWSYYDCLERKVREEAVDFRGAERAMGDAVTHPLVGQLLLLRTGASREVVAAVAEHHDPQPLPAPLVCLVHLADNLCKDLGMGYVSGERGVYHAAVLEAVRLDEAGLDALRADLRPSVPRQVEDLVKRCQG